MNVISTITNFLMFGSIMMGVLIWITLAVSSDGEGILLGFVLGAIIAGVGCLITWLLNLVMATFAEIAINVEMITQKVCQIAPEVVKSDRENKPEGAVKAGMPTTTMKGVDIADYPHDAQSEWVCSSCKSVNKIGTKYCPNCGCGVALR